MTALDWTQSNYQRQLRRGWPMRAWQFATIVFAFTGCAAVAIAQPTYMEPSGFSLTCYGRHAYTGESVPVVGMNGYAYGFWGYATHNQYGWPVMIFDVNQLQNLPPIVTRFVYYHECAHHAVPTSNEVQANCIGLRQMRLAGHIDAAGEATLAQITSNLGPLAGQYLGSGIAFWNATIQCAGPQ